ncbi:hypothetical protein CRE_23288 [Caenorhabditis remanei]|uniref:Uncharacterized protein n=1 Tax=Caenorhabditis remanei TaxID=31234 RepID=E3NVV0_CAERE|nr:hypothetical protein CRE_23288 [Caenorhabditis remanei]
MKVTWLFFFLLLLLLLFDDTLARGGGGRGGRGRGRGHSGSRGNGGSRGKASMRSGIRGSSSYSGGVRSGAYGYKTWVFFRSESLKIGLKSIFRDSSEPKSFKTAKLQKDSVLQRHSHGCSTLQQQNFPKSSILENFNSGTIRNKMV